MLITRNGQSPIVHPSAVIASSAQVIGNVSIGSHVTLTTMPSLRVAAPPSKLLTM